MVASSPPRAADLRPAPRVALFASWHRARSAPWGPPFFRHCGPPLRGTGGPWAGRGPRPERCCRFGGPPRTGASAPEDGGLASLPPRIAAVGQPGGPPRRSALLSRPGLGLVGLRGGRGLRGGWLFPGPPCALSRLSGLAHLGAYLAASQPYGGTTAAAWACSHNPRHTRCASKASAAGAHRAPCCRNCLHEHNKGRRKCAAGSCCTVRASPLLPPRPCRPRWGLPPPSRLRRASPWCPAASAQSGLDFPRCLCYSVRARPVPLLRGLPSGYPWTARKPLDRKAGRFFYALLAALLPTENHRSAAQHVNRKTRPPPRRIAPSEQTPKSKPTPGPKLRERGKPPLQAKQKTKLDTKTSGRRLHRLPRPTQQNLCYFVAFTGSQEKAAVAPR